ncbi:hypothetical protein FBU59_000982 [Linderina macrospora]|uniref:Uncharacterized protein n=1 Tax=Linderina macrospora TaxID=4868 RepID=A0ACC1JFJ7_9FUNG|nr:hypothetical protein FBU59_000982 [Linderina macrospora]
MSSSPAHSALKQKVDSISNGDSEASVVSLLGEPTSRESSGDSTKLIWSCPGHASSYIYAVIKDGSVTSSGWSE